MAYGEVGGQAYLAPDVSAGMRRLRGNSRGLSEIVGTLMLVLIVIGAAVALGAFVAGYEKQLLKQESITHDKDLESLTIIDASIPEAPLTGVSAPPSWGVVAFTLASTSVELSSITGILINDLPILNACALPVDTILAASQNCTLIGGQWITAGTGFPVTAQSELEIVANLNDTQGFLTPTNPGLNALNNAPGTASPPNASVPLVIQVFTAYSNVFTGKFSSPIAIGAVVSIPLPGTSSAVTALDGEASIQTGNDSIFVWDWNIYNITGQTNTTGTGAIFPWSPGGSTFSYRITLGVEDEAGLFDAVSFDWPAP